MPYQKIVDPCPDPEHKLPAAADVLPGLYRHNCETCRRIVVFRVHSGTNVDHPEISIPPWSEILSVTFGGAP